MVGWFTPPQLVKSERFSRLDTATKITGELPNQPAEKNEIEDTLVQRLLSGKRLLIWYAIVPALLFFTLTWFIPIGYGFLMSFTDWSPMSLRGTDWVGLENYQRMIENPDMGLAVRNSIFYALFVVIVRLIIALPLAVMIHNLSFGKNFYRFIYFLPLVTSVVAVGIIWRILYLPRLGLFNVILGGIRDFFGMAFPLPRYLLDPNTALISVGVMDIWRSLGFQIVILMAGLSGIPKAYYEAAEIDGAGSWQRFRHITLPLLQPVILFALVTSIAGAVQVFTEIFVIFQGSNTSSGGYGGPAKAALTLVPEFFQQAFRNFNFGYASAIAVVIFVIVSALSLLQLWLGRRRWDY